MGKASVSNLMDHSLDFWIPKNNMTSNFSVDYFSDSKYEWLTAEVSYDGQILCQINRDKGIDRMEIEFFHEQRILENQPELKFPISEFLSLVKEVQVELSNLAS